MKIKLTHYLLSLWEYPDMPGQIHLKQATNICCFYGTLVTSKLVGTFWALWANLSFKNRDPPSSYFSLWCLTSWEIIRKNWWPRGLALQTDGKTNKRLLLHPVFAPRRHYGFSVAVWRYILVRLGVELFVSQGLIQTETTGQ